MAAAAAASASAFPSLSRIIPPTCVPEPASSLPEWLRFVFLSPCPQRVVSSAVDIIFLLTLFFIFLRGLWLRVYWAKPSSSHLYKPLIGEQKLEVRTNFSFKLSLLLAITLSFSSLILFIFTAVGENFQSSVEIFFLLSKAVASLGMFIFILHENSLGAFSHPRVLRLYWVGSFLVAFLLTASSVIRSVHYGFRGLDAFSVATFLIYVFFLYLGIRGSTGVFVNLKRESESTGEDVTAFASASIFSRATFHWMNKLLSKGYKSPLQLADVPTLAPEHRSERLYELFQTNWPSPALRTEKPVLTTLLRCFWPNLLLTATLSLVRLSVLYIGPMMVNRFVDFVSRKERSSTYEGLILCGILFSAKIVEVFASHQCSFESQKLGMLIRSSLISTLYRKGLRLSCSSRQSHGVGPIVNYMAVDAQQLSDVVVQLHYLWLTPLQVTGAVGLLYFSVGSAMATAAVLTIALLVCVVWGVRRNKRSQLGVMRMRDKRMKAANELLNYIRVVKFQAWEDHFKMRIQKLRDEEFSWLKKFFYSFSTDIVVLWSAPVVLSTLTFVTCIQAGVKLDAGKVFTAMSLFRVLQEPLRNFPEALIQSAQALISLRRLDEFLTTRELQEGTVEKVQEGFIDGVAIEVREGNFSWDDDPTMGSGGFLRDVNVVIKKGSLGAVVGTVGSGKSSFISCLLGEMNRISGKVRVWGTTAYVAQTAWIQNGTIQENILFGAPMVPEKYQEVLRVCCLEKDMEMMEFGDQTEIGERGINLSGGQKQRIQLARAVYQDCDVYLLDDVFSAVDAETGSFIFKECVRGLLKEKTVVLVTHQVDLLHSADLILVMRQGRIVQSGVYRELLGTGTDFAALVAAHAASMELVEQSSMKAPEQLLPAQSLGRAKEQSAAELVKEEKGTAKLIDEEQREVGRVSLRVYKTYATEAWGWWGIFAMVVTSIAWQLSLMAGDYWLAFETSAQNAASFKPLVFIRVYAAISSVSIVLVAVRAFVIALLGLATARIFFRQLLDSILHAPMSFFDTTPSGRILSRLSSDQANIDLLLPFFCGLGVMFFISVIGVLVVTCQVAWPTVIVVLPLGLINFWFRGYYLATSRELTRLDSITKAPLIHHLSESMTGVSTIRCFGKEERFCKESVDRIDGNLRMDFHNSASNEWLAFRLELMGALILSVSALFLVVLPSSIVKPEYVGLSLSYGLSLNVTLFWAISISCLVENRMVSVERIKQFTNIPSEAAWRIKGSIPTASWPTRGNIDLRDLKVRYRANTPMILKGITLRIKGGEKIGVVGRTGSGKSTLIQALFRVVEPCAGKIIIDGIDISTLGLHDLRSRFGIIPQEPVLFEGTVRSNIDPTGVHTDDEIWKSLERCQLKEAVAAKPEKLDSMVVDSGDNWSLGQRQLFCLGRVMLKHSRILFMDEATASVDSQTDEVIQQIIREHFASCTIISIAHRIPTVMDCDRVLVVDAGLAAEFDTPSNLIERPSLFGALVQEYANRSSGL